MGTRKKAPDAARKLARSISSKNSYRRRRDRKIGVEMLGNDYSSSEHGTVTIISYDRRVHRVRLVRQFGPGIWMDTDEFWDRLRDGRVVAQ